MYVYVHIHTYLNILVMITYPLLCQTPHRIQKVFLSTLSTSSVLLVLFVCLFLPLVLLVLLVLLLLILPLRIRIFHCAHHKCEDVTALRRSHGRVT